MEIVRCENGHYYDSVKYKKCPHCGVDLGINRESAVTVANDSVREQNTVAKSSNAKHDPVREAMTQMHMGAKETKTVGYFSRKLGIDPVVGWLVCIEGPEKGRDYRLHYGRNFIGRSAKMDVCIVEDDQISRDNHASIIYEPKKNAFILVYGEGTGAALNDTAVDKPEKLKDGDIIKIGATVLEFIAYCKGESKWQEE
ncbi:MAG: FHA domain-containing protein, partial [Eubacteriales bacterium]|nr:FHA domain-containing protein [Eubacteriales bacterium]